MKFFRHPPLLAWTIVVILMVVLGVAAFNAKPSQPTLARGRSAPPASAEVATIHALRHRMTELVAIRTNPAQSLSTWSAETARMAEKAAGTRIGAGAPKDDSIVVAYKKLAEVSKDLSATDPKDTTAVNSGVAFVLALGDDLAALAGGFDPGPLSPPPGQVAPRETVPVSTTAPVAPLPGTPPAPTVKESTTPTLPPQSPLPALPVLPPLEVQS